jgi:hypothetical protein
MLTSGAACVEHIYICTTVPLALSMKAGAPSLIDIDSVQKAFLINDIAGQTDHFFGNAI